MNILDNNMLKKQADTIRFLSLDMVEGAKSGHPGAPMGLADIATVLSMHINLYPKELKWINRDRLVFSGGHASALAYSLLYLWGFDLDLDDLKNFRQLNSKTPGHPEYGHTSGIEVTTGPLGQGLANAVGFAMATFFTKNYVNKDEELIDHKIYCFCGDGDLQEGISYEACSLAGLYNLNNLILIYDSNDITIEGNTSLSMNEDVKARFLSHSWEVIQIDGHNYEEINQALDKAKLATKPCIIIAKTKIAKGSYSFEGSHKSHGAPLGEEEIKLSKEKSGFDANKKFFVDEDVLVRFRSIIERGELSFKIWEKKYNSSISSKNALNKLLNPDFSKIIYPKFDKPLATRSSNGKILNAISKSIDGFLGGSADLAPSNNTKLDDKENFPKGNNISFGIREHSMAAISNGISLYGTLIPFSATFFVFSDYLKPAARLAALMSLRHFFIFTHDSIGVGEDGPTHQPIEHLTQFRALPNFYLFRPCDANENVDLWKKALTLKAPCAFVLSRQVLPILDRTNMSGDLSKGAYILAKTYGALVNLIASGSEVSLCVDAKKALEKEGIKVNVISVPCFDIFIEQDKEYIDSIIPEDSLNLVVELGAGLEWYRFSKHMIVMNSFGASAKSNDLFKYFGFTVENIKTKVKALLKRDS